MRFVALWTLQRGRLERPEPLNMAGQRAARLRMERDAALDADRVVWAMPVRRAIVEARWSEHSETTGRVSRLMRLSARIGSVA